MTACHGAKGTGTLYSYAQLEGLWINAGGPKSLAPIMAAIAEAESGGCTTAYNASGATGLWQILGAVDPSDQPKLTDAAINAKEAVLKYKDQGLGAWVTYTTGAYKAFLHGGTTPDTSVPGSGGGSTSTATLTAATSAGCLVALPSASAKVLGIGPTIGGGCIVTKTEGRAVIAAMVMLSGGVILGVGALILVAIGLKHAGAGKAAGGALEAGGAAAAVLGAPEVGVPLAAAGASVRRSGARRAATTAAVRSGKRQVAANRTAARQQQAAAQRAAKPAPAPKGPQGRHAKAGPNRPAQGRHAAPVAQPA